MIHDQVDRIRSTDQEKTISAGMRERERERERRRVFRMLAARARATAWSDLAGLTGCTSARFSSASWLSTFFRKGTESTKAQPASADGSDTTTGTNKTCSTTIHKEGRAKLLVEDEEAALRRRTQYHLSTPSTVSRELSLILLENFISKRTEELQANMKHMHLRIWKSDKAMSRKQARESKKPPGKEDANQHLEKACTPVC